MTEPAIMATAYQAIALQLRCLAVNQCTTRDAARETIAAMLDRLDTQLARLKAVGGDELRLIVLPEYFLTGFPLDESIEEWRDKAALAANGPEYERLAGMAQAHRLYLSTNAYETDPHFPDLYFQTCVVFDPSGDQCLRYRRMISLYGPTPVDVWDRYLDIYGLDSIFPVATTAIGKLAAIASEEILYPEIARCHAMQGAEVLLHNSAEFASPRPTNKEICRLARAVENMAYVVSANSASIEGTDILDRTTDAMSKIIDYRGMVIAEAGYGETMAAGAEIDLGALRRHRARPGMLNYLSRAPYQAFAPYYAKAGAYPMNALIEGSEVKVPRRAALRLRQERVIERLRETGLL